MKPLPVAQLAVVDGRPARRPSCSYYVIDCECGMDLIAIAAESKCPACGRLIRVEFAEYKRTTK